MYDERATYIQIYDSLLPALHFSVILHHAVIEYTKLQTKRTFNVTNLTKHHPI